MATPIYGTENFATTLNVGGGINNSQTTGIILTSVSNLDTNGGILGLDWASTIDASTYEEIEYGGISGNELTGVSRGVNGTSAKAHSNGAVIAAVISKTHINRLADKLRGVDAVAVQDPNGNEVIKSDYVSSAVNEITALNAATGNPPQLKATGGDTNIDIQLKAKGTGKIIANAIYGAVTTDTDGATITMDCSQAAGNRHRVVLGGNRILALSNEKSGQVLIADLIQDGTGSRTVTWFQGPGITTTMTIAAPGVLTTGVDIPTGTPIILTTTGALPTGLTAGTVYWYTNVSTTTGKLSTTLANCQAGTYITTSGSQSGVHTLKCQIRWFPSQTTPTLSTGKFVIDTATIYVVDSTVGIYQGYMAGQGG